MVRVENVDVDRKRHRNRRQSHRVAEIDQRIASNTYRIGDAATSTSTTRYVREIFELATARLRGEQQWARDVSERIRAGDYLFAGEDDEAHVVSG